MKNISHNPNANPKPAQSNSAVDGGIYHHGRGAQINTKTNFSSTNQQKNISKESMIGKKNFKYNLSRTGSKTIVNKIESPDVGMSYSMNPYAGCEHGCIYCYARNVHEYWGYSAGMDFEQKLSLRKMRPVCCANFSCTRNGMQRRSCSAVIQTVISLQNKPIG